MAHRQQRAASSQWRPVAEALEGRALLSAGVISVAERLRPAAWHNLFRIEAQGGTSARFERVDHFLTRVDLALHDLVASGRPVPPALQSVIGPLDAALHPTVPTQPSSAPTTSTNPSPPTPPPTPKPSPRVGQTGPLPQLTQDQIDTAYLAWLEPGREAFLYTVAAGPAVSTPLQVYSVPPALVGTTLVPGIPQVIGAPNTSTLDARVANLVPRWGNAPANYQQIEQSLRVPPTVLSYHWDLSQAPDASSASGLGTPELKIQWAAPAQGTYGVDSVTLTATLADQTVLTQTYEFLIVGATDSTFIGADQAYPQPSQKVITAITPM